jgi:radical SAM superfamily enzyme YgiQ (UPF0313 family)
MKNKLRKFMFVVPNTRWFGKRCWFWFVPAVTILTPLLRGRGFEVEIVEANVDNLTLEETRERIREFSPGAVGISNMSVEYWKQLHACARLAKEVSPEIITIAGGVHPTTLPERVMADTNIDYVILNEGEERLPALLQALASGDDWCGLNGLLYRKDGIVIKNPSAGWFMDLDSVSVPDYSIYNNCMKIFNSSQSAAGGVNTRRAPVAPILSSRGCPHKCCFCSGPVTSGRKMRFRSPENVLKEIDMLVNDYGVKEIIFQDDEMYADKERTRQIVQMIKDRKYDLIWKNTNLSSWRLDYDAINLMKESGCYQITISPESGNHRVLKEIIHKPAKMDTVRDVVRWCKELDVEILCDFVIGFPGETWDEIRDTTNFADELDADAVKFAVATPFPGTELFQVSVERGLFPADYDFYSDHYLGFANPTIDTEHWSKLDLKMIRVMEWDRINFKTPEKKARYAKVNGLTLEQVEDFRRNTRKNLGVFFFDQAEDRRVEGLKQDA